MERILNRETKSETTYEPRDSPFVEFYGEFKRGDDEQADRLYGVKRRRAKAEEGTYALHAPSEVDGLGRGRLPDSGAYADLYGKFKRSDDDGGGPPGRGHEA